MAPSTDASTTPTEATPPSPQPSASTRRASAVSPPNDAKHPRHRAASRRPRSRILVLTPSALRTSKPQPRHRDVALRVHLLFLAGAASTPTSPTPSASTSSRCFVLDREHDVEQYRDPDAATLPYVAYDNPPYRTPGHNDVVATLPRPRLLPAPHNPVTTSNLESNEERSEGGVYEHQGGGFAE